MLLTQLHPGDKVSVLRKRAHVHPIGVPVPVLVSFDAVHAGTEVYDDPDETYISYHYPSGAFETVALYDLQEIICDGEPVVFEFI